MAKKNKKVIKYKKPWNLNVGVIIFAFIFIYLVASVAVYLSKEKIHIYEVTEGALAEYSDYNALILRDEIVTSCENSGYINYYIRDGRKVGVNDLIYTIDETGKILELLNQNGTDNSLPTEDLEKFKSELVQFAVSYDPMNFSSVYDMKASIQTSLLEYVSSNALEELSGQLSGENTSNFVRAYTSMSGVICTVLDGLEGMTPQQVTAQAFDSASHPKKMLGSGQAVESSTNVYKTIGSEEWYLIFQITETDRERFAGVNSLTLTFKGTSLKTSGSFEMYTGADGGTYGKITLNRYMVQFVDKRYVNIQIETENVRGLKIPSSSVVYKSFYQVPRSCLTQDGVLLVESYGTDGTVTVEKATPVTYASDEEYCYLDASKYAAGQNIVIEDSNERFQLRQVTQLPGVYNINKGYAVFRKIRILKEGEEYLIISSRESSVSVYDHIALNGEMVEENDIIYY